MSTIDEIHVETGVAMRTLRRLEKAGYLRLTHAHNPTLAKIRVGLKRGNPLSAYQQFHLLKHPEDYATIMAQYPAVRDTLAALGNVEATAAPWNGVSAQIDIAARNNNPEATAAIADYLLDLFSTLAPGVSVNHAYIAVRLLWNVPAAHLDSIAPKLIGALWRTRLDERLAGFFSVDANSKTVRYFNVDAKKALDAMDL